MKHFLRAFLLIPLLLCLSVHGAETPRATIARAMLTTDAAAQRALVTSLVGQGDEAIPELLTAWRNDAIFLYTAEGTTIPVTLTGEKDAAGAQAAVRVDDGQSLKDAAGQPLRIVGKSYKTADHTSALRRAMKAVLDIVDLVSPVRAKRLQAVQTIGQAQDASKAAVLESRLPLETDAHVKRALREALALIRLKDANETVKLAALAELKELSTLSSADFLKKALQEAEAQKNATLIAAAKSALHSVESHRSVVDFLGTIFRGLSLGSILLVLALGLAITFGL